MQNTVIVSKLRWGGGGTDSLNLTTGKRVYRNILRTPKCKSFLRIFSIADAFNIKTRFSLAEIFSLISGRFCLCKYAFTLAEVLITLGIIGIVAAMTLPTLVQNHKNAELQTGLKKAYSVLSQALDLYYAKNGERIKPDGTVGSQSLQKMIMPYFINAKNCGTGSGNNASKACVPNNSYVDEDSRKADIYKSYNGQKANFAFLDDGQFLVNDGMLVLIENTVGGTTLFLSVDVNGYNKRPNRFGQDLFTFQIDKKGILKPMGAEGTTFPLSEYPSYCNPKSTDINNGISCTYKALTEPDYFKNLPK